MSTWRPPAYGWTALAIASHSDSSCTADHRGVPEPGHVMPMATVLHPRRREDCGLHRMQSIHWVRRVPRTHRGEQNKYVPDCTRQGDDSDARSARSRRTAHPRTQPRRTYALALAHHPRPRTCRARPRPCPCRRNRTRTSPRAPSRPRGRAQPLALASRQPILRADGTWPVRWFAGAHRGLRRAAGDARPQISPVKRL